MKQKKTRNRPLAEINVVPYIDVTLVLLVVFMITAPLLMQGVKVELPQANSAPMKNNDNEPFIISIKADGTFWIDDKGTNTIETLTKIKSRVGKVIRQSPGTPILVWGDGQVAYASVVELMSELQNAGAPSVGLVTEPPSE
ncbi:MAG: protein TolR [Porticoccaceae bacterium]|nr:protein TolR [Porticoccaceae bacterium]